LYCIYIYIYKHKLKTTKIMIKAVQRSNKDYMGFMWFELYKNGKSTGNSINAQDKEHAVKIYNQFKK